MWSTYLASDDLDATVAVARAAGSTFMMEPMDVMTAGRLAFGMDPTGASSGIWQAGERIGVGVYNEPDALVWNELVTGDYEGAKAFYAAVFGYGYDEVGEGFAYSTLRRCADGEVVAGLGELDAAAPAGQVASWRVYFMVADCDASAAKAFCLIQAPKGDHDARAASPL